MSPARRWLAGRWARPALALVAAGLAAWAISALLQRGDWPAHATLAPAEPAGSQPLGFTPDGRAFLAAGADGLTSWDVAAGRRLGVTPEPGPGWRSFAGDGAGFAGILVTPMGRFELARGEVATGAVRARAALPGTPLLPPTWSPGDRSVRCLLRAASGGFEVATWDLASGRVEARPLAAPARYNGPVALAPDGRTLACTDLIGGNLLLWDVEADRPVGAEFRAAATMLGGVPGLAFTPDGRTLVVGPGDGTLELWDAARGRLARTIPAPSAGYASYALAVAPDGRTLAAAGAAHRSSPWTAFGQWLGWLGRGGGGPMSLEVVVVDLATGRTLARAGGEASPAFSPDGRWLVTHRPGASFLVRAAPRPDAAGQ